MLCQISFKFLKDVFWYIIQSISSYKLCFKIVLFCDNLGQCGFFSNATLKEKNLTSPGWPRKYNNSLTCTWTLYGQSGAKIQLHFKFFRRENVRDVLVCFLSAIKYNSYESCQNEFCGLIKICCKL